MKALKKQSEVVELASTSKELAIDIPRVVRETIQLPVMGTSGMIPHRFSEKIKKEMLEKHTGKSAAKAKAPKDIHANLAGTLHYFNSADEEIFLERLRSKDKKPGDDVSDCLTDIQIGFPAIGFKKATVGACRNVDGIPMTLARGAFFVQAEENGLVEILYDSVAFREDMVRNSNGQPDIRHRCELQNWRANLKIILNPGVMSTKQLAGLIDIGGFAVGVGDWRPEKNGDNGTYTVDLEGGGNE